MNQETAATILQQIGKGALYMIGAKNFGVGPAGLSFKIGRNSKGVSYIRFTLNSMDLYDLEYVRVRGIKMTTVSTDKNVYFDGLRESIERNTGLVTSKPVIIGL